VSTKSISTSIAHSACDVCGRTLLRGERAEIYVSGGARRSVCELCTSRALHGGWVREGTVPSYEDRGARVDRRRSLLSRFRGRRESAANVEATPNGSEEPRPQPQPASAEPSGQRNGYGRQPQPVREPRHVRAVPTSTEHKISSAVALFNRSEHPRTVAGIARSLGLPEVSVLPAQGTPSAVSVLVAWELCWYRYEVDLSDEVPSLRVAGQGYELDELAPGERQPNAVADDRGTLLLA
jgi:hypothetical protein